MLTIEWWQDLFIGHWDVHGEQLADVKSVVGQFGNDSV